VHNLAVLSDLPQSFSTSVPKAAFPPENRYINDAFIQASRMKDINIVKVHDEDYTLTVDRHVARYFLISVSDPGSSFRERCVRCLKAFVSTILRFEGPWSNADEADVSCNRNLKRNSSCYNQYTLRKV